MYKTEPFLHSGILIVAVRTPIKKFQMKKPPARNPNRKAGMDVDLDLEEEFTSTPPPTN